MTTTAPTLPPPLSAPPSVATLQGLLDGLQQPMQRGVPSPPAVHAAAVGRAPAAGGEVADTARRDGAAVRQDEGVAQMWGEAAGPADMPVPTAVPTPADDSVAAHDVADASDPDGPSAPLTWSAGRHRPHLRRIAAVVAAAGAVGALTALAAVGELGLS